jgi:hypothetical protein
MSANIEDTLDIAKRVLLHRIREVSPFLEDFQRRIEKPYKKYGIIGEPLSTKNQNLPAMANCVGTGTRSIKELIRSAEVEGAALKTAGDKSLKELLDVAKAYELLFRNIAAIDHKNSCRRFTRLFKEKAKYTEYYEAFQAIYMELKKADNKIKGDKAVEEIVAFYDAMLAMEAKRSMPNVPTSKPRGGARRTRRLRRRQTR